LSCTSYFHDALGRRFATVFPDGAASTNYFHALGRGIAATDERNNPTWFGYDERGMRTALTNALGEITRYEYDEQGRQVTQLDALNRATRYEYDRLGRRTKRTLPLNQVDAYACNAVGDLIAKTDFNGCTTTYTHDSLNRLTARVPDAAFAAPPVTLAYNEPGLRTHMTDASGVTSYRYDNRNRLIEKATLQGTLLYAYDPHSNITNRR
jgi:YD repeat-containing protein